MESTNENTIYHECQRKLLCAVHALNNLLQRPAFTQASLDAICEELTPQKSLWNPHRNPLGLGNYDVNVIMKAVNQFDLQVAWFDRRKSLDSILFSRIFGVIVNIHAPYKLGIAVIPFIEGKHWIAYRQLEQPTCPSNGEPVKRLFYNLDSKLPKPLVVANSEEDFKKYLTDLFAKNTDAQLLIICSSEVVDGKLWCKDTNIVST